jgi:cellulose synthase/poly-beta-1,6-N-acetylglucosamine synthase-like glycosyltransferase
MTDAHTIISYTISFLAIYAQIFLLVTFFENRRGLVFHKGELVLGSYPTVTIAVPCYNEAATIESTIESLQQIDYPKDKITIFLIDDGSTDNTWSVLQKFKTYPRIRLFQKENGGKHTALNLALQYTTSEFFGCLDSDSFVDPQALKRIMALFEADPNTMSVAPAIRVNNPDNILQKAQKVEYDMSIYIKKMIGFIGGINVTPGPFSIFRKKVFDDLGPYVKAHNTEDQEIALRMQEHGYKIDHCPDAYIYTNAPATVPKLYRQRIRWTYGSLKNIIDYRRLLFRKKYGAVGMFTLPSNLVSTFGVIFIGSTVIYNISSYLYYKFVQIRVSGIVMRSPTYHFTFDWFFVNTRATFILSLVVYLLVIVSMTIGRKMAQEKTNFTFSLNVLYFVVIYSLIAPLWIAKSVYNTLVSKESSWTLERI